MLPMRRSLDDKSSRRVLAAMQQSRLRQLKIKKLLFCKRFCRKARIVSKKKIFCFTISVKLRTKFKSIKVLYLNYS
uniref:Uncharacterized protein n=1 Tax=Phlebia radiata TaxID=5308 RepID=L8B9A3_PHLRA|nr:hypothetical protein PRA_mt0049 [Phlebia radiata]CCE89176.1 hypothetical protein PRA_mt0049 [Phlebia radiata]